MGEEVEGLGLVLGRGSAGILVDRDLFLEGAGEDDDGAEAGLILGVLADGEFHGDGTGFPFLLLDGKEGIPVVRGADDFPVGVGREDDVGRGALPLGVDRLFRRDGEGVHRDILLAGHGQEGQACRCDR